MKMIIAVLSLVMSFSVFADPTRSAVSAFVSVLPLGSYVGIDEQGNNCEVEVREANFPARAIAITASNYQRKVLKEVADGSEYLLRGFRKEFIQTEKVKLNSSGTSRIEKVVRTFIAGENKLYVVVSHSVIDNRDVKRNTVECIVNL